MSLKKIIRSAKIYLWKRQAGVSELPPENLRYRVHGNKDLYTFLKVGRTFRSDIKSALKRIDKKISSFQNILDFGCGCGRPLMWLANRSGRSFFYGTDIDESTISWCRANMKHCKFGVNGHLPPLEYPAENFDLIYALSVFTHLNREYQARWLEELKRVAKKDCILLITIQGKSIWENLPKEDRERVRKDGFAFRQSGFWKNIFPDWYEDAYFTREHALDEYGKYFKVLDYLPKGLNNHQDILILQK